MKHINGREFLEEVKCVLSSSVGHDYAKVIACDDRFFPAVIQDVEEASAWNDEGCYSDDDIRFAIGRVIMKALKIEGM